MAETTEETLARVRASFDRQGMMSTLGVEVTSVEPGKVEMSLRHDERFTQQHGFLHAGAVASVLDTACGYAALSVMPPDAAVLTASYTINLLAPAAGERFRIAAEVVRAGRTLVVCRGEAFEIGIPGCLGHGARFCHKRRAMPFRSRPRRLRSPPGTARVPTARSGSPGSAPRAVA